MERSLVRMAFRKSYSRLIRELCKDPGNECVFHDSYWLLSALKIIVIEEINFEKFHKAAQILCLLRETLLPPPPTLQHQQDLGETVKVNEDDTMNSNPLIAAVTDPGRQPLSANKFPRVHGEEAELGVPRGGAPTQFPGPPPQSAGKFQQRMGAVGGGSTPHANGMNRLANNFGELEWPELNKDWHKQVTPDVRNHLVGRLVKAIFPLPIRRPFDQRIKDLIAYAKRVEKEMFEVANDREEYIHLLAEKIYKIQKELQKKKRDRHMSEMAQPWRISFN